MDAEVTQKENRRVTGQLQGTEETTRPHEGLAHRERTHGSTHSRATVWALYTSLSDLREALPTCLGVRSRCKISLLGSWQMARPAGYLHTELCVLRSAFSSPTAEPLR